MTTTTTNPSAAPEHPPPPHECCMCGDHGLAGELFRCSLCLFRSQHRYCSNVYPKAESYTACNWCLLAGDSAAGKAQKRGRRGNLKVEVIKGSPSPSPSPSGRRIVSNGRMEEMMMIRRTKSEGIVVKNSIGNGNGNVNVNASKQVFRNKVRRYKLLEEVSS